MQPPERQDDGLALTPVHDSSSARLSEQSLQPPLEDDRSADILETHSIKWNVARIVRLSSGRFALLTHYRAGALDIIKVGTIEEILPFIPTVEQCEPDYEPRKSMARGLGKADLTELMADIGLT